MPPLQLLNYFFFYLSIVLGDKIQKEGSTCLSSAYSMVDGFSPVQLNWLLQLWSITLNRILYNTFSMLPAFSRLSSLSNCCAFSLLSSLFHKPLVNVGALLWWCHSAEHNAIESPVQLWISIHIHILTGMKSLFFPEQKRRIQVLFVCVYY